MPLLGLGMLPDEESPEGEGLIKALNAGAQDTAARQVPVMDLDRAQDYLKLRAGFSVASKAVSHWCQLPSNLPCEDAIHAGVYNLFNDPAKDWATWSIFDGHAGSRTSQLLQEFLPVIVGSQLWEAKCMDRPYTPNDTHIIRTIKKAFMDADDDILNDASQRVQSGEGDLSHTISMISAALSGSCALVSLFDQAKGILRVANTGDSRAVLGRWDDETGKYVAKPMSVDQTGFNQGEIERLRRDHPDEEPVDPKTGRVHGIAVSRAFGDSRWKWPNELSQLVHEKLWGPIPRPDGMIKTPPYLTAEPEVTEAKVQTGQHPDFLILASDGLWDNISSEDAVTCVHQWMDKFKPAEFLQNEDVVASFSEVFRRKKSAPQSPKSLHVHEVSADEDTYFDPNEKAMKWRVSPIHFVVEDDNCGIHLIKNALGGKRRNLFCGVMSIQPPLSRNVRDDITVQVIFFGMDTEKAAKKLNRNQTRSTKEPSQHNAST